MGRNLVLEPIPIPRDPYSSLNRSLAIWRTRPVARVAGAAPGRQREGAGRLCGAPRRHAAPASRAVIG